MHDAVDVLVVGAGPAGMAAAIRMQRSGLSVLVIDAQRTPGGQIWRNVEALAETPTGRILGDDYRSGAAVVREFHASGAAFQPETELWQLEPSWRGYVTRDRRSGTIQAQAVLLATGAQERPAPFPGWTLPGVMTVGAAQIALKSSDQVPVGPLWLAGAGPLPLLYVAQLLEAGGSIQGYLDTTPLGNFGRALWRLPRAGTGWKDLLKGARWLNLLRRRGVRVIRGVSSLEALGTTEITGIRYRTWSGAEQTAEAATLLVHEGVVPEVHLTLSLGCAHEWNAAQACLRPRLDKFGAASSNGIYVAGDAGGIAGAQAALVSGEIAAIGIAKRLGRHTDGEAEQLAAPLRSRLAATVSARPFLDALFGPRPEIFAPADRAVVCRCEEITAGELRAAASIGRPGPNQVKAFTRAGMGPCQGRQCGYTVTHLIASEQGIAPSELGFFNIRPPLKPISLGELAGTDLGL